MKADEATTGRDDGAGESKDSAKLVSQIAKEAKQRKEAVDQAVKRERPAYILDIEQSEVVYTLPPRMLPFRHVDHIALLKAFRQKWKIKPDLSSVRLEPGLAQALTTAEDYEAAVIEHVFSSASPELTFRAGSYTVSDFEFVAIRGITMNFESVLVSVSGISRVAEAVAQETVEIITRLAGSSRSWADIKPHVQIVGYATKTKVDLGRPSALESMLSPRVREFIDKKIVADGGFGASAGNFHARNGLKAPPNAMVSVAVDDIGLNLSRFDLDSGMYVSSNMRLSVTARGDYKSGIVSFSSELPYEEHVECVGDLVEALKEEADSP